MRNKRHAQIDTNLCVACGTCLTVCPRSAIQIEKSCFAKVNKELCIGCGKCTKACPASIIQIILEHANKL